MYINKITSLEQYKEHLSTNKENLKRLKEVEAKTTKKLKGKKQIELKGFSWPAQTESSFLVDYKYSNKKAINFRERLVCEKTKLNNRIRGCVHIFETEFNPKKNDQIYLTEQCSLLARWMKRKYTKLSMSEYTSDSSWYYKLRLNLRLFPNKLNHQDLTALSYKEKAFKFVLSFDCFEHIPDYKKAFSETYRTLEKGGKLLFSVPFNINQQATLVRARVESGKIKHQTEPEYHGNPISGKGCLSYYTFGWDILDALNDVGFNQSYLLLYWSEKYCYLGGEQIIICAEK